ncbi:DUF6153 family protein [Streptomyces sp. HB2AG]|uniref:DUF6153 family protein n=1 Tax=Streptomyces sp. HB2AG TaxID=2983400 RepID=UPI0022AA780F|nr:DUF6153 family protein [Streptomyces sp. HB2AG]MCZ2524084.1 DUF6153 family protein [Streptomyces sp. HB2AG]
MTVRAQPRRVPSPPRRWPALLVLGLLVGLFGMHGLAPGGATALTGDHASPSPSSAAAHHADPALPNAESACGGGDDRGHAEHADATCSSGAVGTGPVLPAPAPDPTGRAGEPADGRPSTAAAPEGGRASLSLAELQLLRT